MIVLILDKGVRERFKGNRNRQGRTWNWKEFVCSAIENNQMKQK